MPPTSEKTGSPFLLKKTTKPHLFFLGRPSPDDSSSPRPGAAPVLAPLCHRQEKLRGTPPPLPVDPVRKVQDPSPMNLHDADLNLRSFFLSFSSVQSLSGWWDGSAARGSVLKSEARSRDCSFPSRRHRIHGSCAVFGCIFVDWSVQPEG